MGNMGNLIIKNNTRIFRPGEIEKIIEAIPKQEYKVKFEALLFSGARYTEMQWLYKHPKFFDGNTIKMPKRKPKQIYDERYIRLNSHGKRAVSYFLRSKKNLPSDYATWIENLHRWCDIAGVEKDGVSTKSTRKTWESWLVTMYPKQLEYIFLSQGHNTLTALKFYLMIPFTQEDINNIKYYTDGWI